MLLLGDPRIQKASAENVGLILRHTYWWPNCEAGIYRPFATLTYLFNYAILGNGDHPAGYHWINFFLHSANVLLVFGLVQRLLSSHARAFQTGLIVAALWAARRTSGCRVRWLVFQRECRRSAGRHSPLRIRMRKNQKHAKGIVGLCLHSDPHRHHACRAHGGTLGIAACGVPVRRQSHSRSRILDRAADRNQGVSALSVAGLLASQTSSDYSYSEIPLARGSAADWISWLTIAAAIALVVFLWRRNRLAFFFACFGFLNLLPASNLFFPTGTIMAERLTYLPLVGLLAAVLIAVNVRGPVALVLVCLIVTALGVRT